MMRLIALLVLLVSTNAPAMAEDSFYVGASFGQSLVDGTAEADTTSFSGGTFPESVSINELPFDSNETAWGGLLGWNARSWLSIEAAYRDLGNFASSANFLTSTAAQPSLAMDVEEWSLGARFRVPVSKRVTANWFVGISRAQFETQGSLPIAIFPPFPFPPIAIIEVPFSTPEDETGYVAGFGFTFGLKDDIGLDLGYRLHDTKVLKINTLALELLLSF